MANIWPTDNLLTEICFKDILPKDICLTDILPIDIWSTGILPNNILPIDNFQTDKWLKDNRKTEIFLTPCLVYSVDQLLIGQQVFFYDVHVDQMSVRQMSFYRKTLKD